MYLDYNLSERQHFQKHDNSLMNYVYKLKRILIQQVVLKSALDLKTYYL